MHGTPKRGAGWPRADEGSYSEAAGSSTKGEAGKEEEGNAGANGAGVDTRPVHVNVNSDIRCGRPARQSHAAVAR